MDAKVITKEKLVELLDQFIRDYEVLAPVRQGDAVVFGQIQRGSDAALDVKRTTMSPKGAFFPQEEVLFIFDGVEAQVPTESGARVLFGVRPCDGRSLTVLDKVFDTAEYPTVYYGNQRERTFVVGVGCNQPPDTCFCTALGGEPFGKAGLDVLLSDLGDRYLVEALTEKGERLLEDSALLQDASEEDIKEGKILAREAREKLNVDLHIEELKAKLGGMFEDPIWAEISMSCLGCGACTYVCPTCHCFDIVDELVEVGGNSGRRVRVWDSCQYPLFTHHASGHNPRPSHRERMRQRIMHKFSYYVNNFGVIACVGCARCLTSCPVNLDIREVLLTLAER
ncbi:MAG: 4Fe-4S ferredoxin [Chloroflexi bacterium]|nr:4Fe-4S ferredoxin [Chloroflexota bacterium]